MAQQDQTATQSSILEPPKDANELHKWIKQHTGITLRCVAIIEGHTPPFDYIVHTFFEGRGLWPPFREHNPAPTLDCIVWANRGGGKTFLGALATALDLIFKPGIQIRILAGSLDQAMHMHNHLRWIFARPSLAHHATGKGRITDKRIRLVNDSTAEILAHSQAAVRGTRVQKLRCDEVELFDPRVWEAAQLTTRSRDCGGVYVRGAIECLSTMHEPHGLMAKLVDEARAGKRRLFRWGVVDCLDKCTDAFHCHPPTAPGEPEADPCPLFPECKGRAKRRDEGDGHIAIEDALRLKSRVSLAAWEAEMLCLRPSRANTVFPEFSSALHVVTAEPAPEEIVQWIGGMDFGYRAPTVILWGAVDWNGRLFIIAEHIETSMVLDEHIRIIRESPWPPPRPRRPLSWIGIDPAGEQRSGQTGLSDAAVMKRAGLNPRHRHSMIREGLALVRARLAPADGAGPRLLIHQRCAGLIKAMESYRYAPDDPTSDQPLKDGPDHACDALRYMIVNLDWRNKVEVRPY